MRETPLVEAQKSRAIEAMILGVALGSILKGKAYFGLKGLDPLGFWESDIGQLAARIIETGRVDADREAAVIERLGLPKRFDLFGGLKFAIDKQSDHRAAARQLADLAARACGVEPKQERETA